MKRYALLAIVLSLVVCGCESRKSEQPPVTVLPSSSSDLAQQKDQQHLQGNSLDADRDSARNMLQRLLQKQECDHYLNYILAHLNSPIYTNCPDGASFKLRMEIYQDGSIGNVAVYGWTNAVYVPLYIQAIKKSHFPKWPDTMYSIVGQDYFIMWIDTGVYPLTVGPC